MGLAATNLSCLALTLMVSATASAQRDPPLVPLDPGRSDVGPLSQSLRIRPLDLRLPSRFDAVYRAPGDQLMRIDGGLTAVFPRSVYRASPSGSVALIPPGTVFHIAPVPDPESRPTTETVPDGHRIADAQRSSLMGTGSIGTRLVPRVSTAVASGRVHSRIESGVTGRAHRTDQPRTESAPGTHTIWHDNAFRARRVESLLKRAASGQATAR